LADLDGFTGAALFQATELPHDVCATPGRVNRVVPPFLLDGSVGLDTQTPVTLAGGAVRLTNFSGTATTFGNAAALATGPCNTLYAALARSHDTNDASEGPFTNPAALGATPSMIVSLADAAGAVDACTSPGGQQPGVLVVDDGIADAARAGLAVAPGVNNFRAFALGNGPDRRGPDDPVFGPDTLRLAFQVDYTIFAGLAVDEERAVYVVSGGTPAGVGTDPSPAFGEILKFPDRAPADRRADFVDLRGDVPPDPPDNGGNTGDGDSDRFDHLFWPAPSDSGSPTGVAGLARGFLRYLNRVPPGQLENLDGLQADDDTNGPVSFDRFDNSMQVAGGDDAIAPFTGDDAADGFEFVFGGLAGGVCTTPWKSFFLNSNGNVTFGVGDAANTSSIPGLLGGPPRIAPAWADLNPQARADGAWNTFPIQALGFAGPNAFKIRWIQVPPFGFETCGGVASVSVTLYDDGTGLDESAPPAVEGPTDARFAGATGAPPREDGRGPVDFEYCRMDVLGTKTSPVLVGYGVGGQDLAFPNICETDVSQAARAAEPGLLGDGTQRLLFEIFADDVKPAPQVPGEIEYDLRFAGNDPASTRVPGQEDPSRDFVSFRGADCDTNADLTCSCALTIDPQTLPTGVVVDAQLAAQGGTPPFSYAVTGGTLPAGLTLDADGRLSGPSAAAGAFSFEVTATDAKSCTARRTLAIDVGCAPAATLPSIGCRLDVLTGAVSALPDGKTKRKLLKLLDAATKRVAGAATQVTAGKTKPARRLVGRANGILKRLGKLLGSKAARKQLDPATRDALAAEATALQADAAALRESLG
jgi:putative Ig domain-containing protein